MQKFFILVELLKVLMYDFYYKKNKYGVCRDFCFMYIGLLCYDIFFKDVCVDMLEDWYYFYFSDNLNLYFFIVMKIRKC